MFCSFLVLTPYVLSTRMMIFSAQLVKLMRHYVCEGQRPGLEHEKRLEIVQEKCILPKQDCKGTLVPDNQVQKCIFCICIPQFSKQTKKNVVTMLAGNTKIE